FVDLGGVDGLVHVSELSWKHVDHPSEVASVGQEVEVEVLDVDLERERVSLSLKATQEDPWKEFERKYSAGEVIAGQITKLVPFGAFVRVGEGIEGLVHISELAEHHVEKPEDEVHVHDRVPVKIIDIDLERRRISLSLKQANEGLTPEMEFDPTQYGMVAEYDAEGNYIYPEGFDPETNDWLEGYDKQREEWERSYADAQIRFEQHRKQVTKAVEAESAEAAGDQQNYSSATTEAPASSSTSSSSGGSLASDEQLAALREKLSGGV
ncbi:MAG: S1 RNA-binding domain-containing protein, partial [Pseudonocardiaceae bacterium]